MPVTITPDAFTMVNFDAARIREIVERLLVDVGLPEDADVTVNIDERVPLGRAEIVSIDPIVLDIEGGALEHPKLPRQLSDEGTADIVGRLLLNVRDRLDPTFGDVPPDKELTLAHASAWDVYCVGRLVRRGYRAQRQRRLYAFRNRHGFTDTADAAFDQLWDGVDLTWAQITAISDDAAASRVSV
jgi:hypothetical protein